MRQNTHSLLSVLLIGSASCGTDSKPIESRPNYISFSPMYSAFDGAHDYALTPSVPSAASSSFDADPVLASSIKWEVDQSFVRRDEFSELPAAIKLTTKKAGETKIRIAAKTLEGRKFISEAKLTISWSNTWAFDVGEDRYNNGGLHAPVRADAGVMCCGVCPLAIELPKNSACGNCHSATSMVARETTPTQTAGYSDKDLIEIFTQGSKPAGGVFTSPFLRAAPMPDCLYKEFHNWEMTEEEKKGIVLKLRSLPPKAYEE